MGVDQLISGGDVDDPVYDSVTATGGDFDSVNTNGLTDSDDGEAWETLREAGFETGDTIPVFTIAGSGTANTTSDSFSNLFINDSAVPERYGIADGGAIRVNLTTILQSNSDAEFAEFRMESNGGDILTDTLSVTSTGKQFVSTGWHVPPEIPQETVRVFGYARSEASNEAFVEEPLLQVGVEL